MTNHLNNLNLYPKFRKVNLILNIFLEKQLFFFIYLYLYFLQRTAITFIRVQNLNIFNDFLIKFCNTFHFSSLVNGLYFLNKIYFIKQCQTALTSMVINKKKKIFKSKFKFRNLNKKFLVLEFKDFYFTKFFKFSKKIHSSSRLNQRKKYNLYKKFVNFSFTMLRLFKLKIIFSIFFRIRSQYNKNLKFISFLGLRRLYNSNIANKFFFKRSCKFLHKIKYFNGKYFNKVKFTTTLTTLSSRLLKSGIIFKNNYYFISKMCDKFSISRKMYILSTGRCLIFRFSKKLQIPIPFKYTKYKKLKSNFIKAKFNHIFNLKFLRDIKKLYKNNLILKSEYIKNFKSTNYFIKKPIQKLIISGKKKLGFNIYNNLFLSLNKLFKKSTLKHIEIINNIYKKLFIRATVKNIERNRSSLGVRQSCSLLMGYEELKSRVNLFFFDYMNSLCKKKTKTVRVVKVKDLVFLDFFKFSMRNNLIKQTSHLATVFSEIYTFMFTELNFRGGFRPFRARILEITKAKKRFKRNTIKIRNYFKMKYKKKFKGFRHKYIKRKKKKIISYKNINFSKLNIIQRCKFLREKFSDNEIINPYIFKKKEKKIISYDFIKKKILKNTDIKTNIWKILTNTRNINIYNYKKRKFLLLCLNLIKSNIKEKHKNIFLHCLLFPSKLKNAVLKKFKVKQIIDDWKYNYEEKKIADIRLLDLNGLNKLKVEKKVIISIIYCIVLSEHKTMKKTKLTYDLDNLIKNNSNFSRFRILSRNIYKAIKSFKLKKKSKLNKYIKFKLNFRLKFAYINFFRKLHFNSTILYREKRAKKKARIFRNITHANVKMKSKIIRKLYKMDKPAKYKHNYESQYMNLKRFFKRKLLKIKKNKKYKYKLKKRRKTFKQIYWKIKLKMKAKRRSNRIKQKTSNISYINKHLKMKTFIYSEDLLTKGITRSISKKHKRFMYKCKQFLNKFFIYKRKGNFIYPKNKSRIKILKICRNLGSERSSLILRTCYLIKNKISLYKNYKKIKYSARKFIIKYLLLSSRTINKLKYMFTNFQKINSKSFFKYIRLSFYKHKFLKFFFYKKFKAILFRNSLKQYRIYLKNIFLFKKYNILKKIFKIFLKYFKLIYTKLYN